jgi:hypothetical protein
MDVEKDLSNNTLLPCASQRQAAAKATLHNSSNEGLGCEPA